MGKVWPALDIHVPSCDAELQDLVLADLDDFHPTAIQDADGAAPLRAFFTTSADRDAAAQALGTAFVPGIFLAPIDIDDEDWAARSQAALRAITIGRLVIAPPWDADNTGKWGRVGVDNTVVIRPSMGFGTGHHATTRLMLQGLQNPPPAGCSVLDVGCGSGVLALAALTLGARSAIGLDIDPDALDNARENALLNGAGAAVQFVEQDFRTWTGRADIVAANLTGALIAQSAEKLISLIERGGRLVASGFMHQETTAVLSALETFGVLEDLTREDEWMCATLIAPDKPQNG